MKFKTSCIPEPSEGRKETQKKLVVPDQALSIREIIERFTRGEAVPVGMKTEFGIEDEDNPLNVDLEKLATADLVDRQEYFDRLRSYRERFEAQEKRKASEAAKKAKDEEEAAKEAAIRAKIEKERGSAQQSA